MGTWDWNVQTGKIIWSDNHERLFGLASGNFQGTYQAFAECVHPEDLDLVEQYLNQAKAERTPYNQEFRVVWLDGSIHWITANGQFFYNEIGEAVRMAGTVMEVTERKATEIALAQREQQYRTLVQNFPVGGVFLFDSDLRYILADGKGLAEVGLSKEFMEGKTIWEILPPETTQIIEPIYRDALAGGSSTSEIHFADRIYLLYALPVKNEQGEILSGMVMSEDITDRKRAELALLQLKDELEIKVQERTADLTDTNQQLQQEIIQRQQAKQELQESELLMRSLHQITTNPQLSLKERFRQVLVIGCQHFNLDFGFIASIKGNEYKVISTQTPDNSVAAGDIFDLRKSYCLVTIEQEEPLCVPHATASEWVNHPGYKGFLMETYISMKIMVNNAMYGTICFSSRSTSSRQFCSVDFELIKLMAQWVGSEIERSQALATLEQLRHQNELILNSAGEGICGINREGNITFVNPAAAKMLGYEVNELINQPICGLLFSSQEDKIAPNLTETFLNPVLKNGKLQHFNNQKLWRKNNSSFPVECIATPMRERTTTNLDSLYQTTHAILDTFLPASSFIPDTVLEIVGVVITFRDITERQAVEKMKDEFISVVSHELRTPLTAIRGSLGLLAAGLLTTQPEKAKRMLEIAAANTDRLTRLINDILDIERIESGKINMEKEACDAQELMVKTAEALRIIAQNTGITLLLGTINARVWVDRDRIIQVLTNLISNAIKFSPPNTTIEISAEWITETCSLPPLDQEGLDNKQPTLLFKVKDQGRGIPIDKLESIFGRFQQVNASDSRDQGGTGLGLAICRSIVQQHNGCIWVQSQLGQGSTFYFTLPAIDEDTKEASKQLLLSSPVSSTPLILLCDDDTSIHEVVQISLQQRGYRVVAVASGQEAIKQASELQPAVILLDLLMPEMDGWATIAGLKEQLSTKHIPIIIFSAFVSEIDKLAHQGVVNWVPKSLTEQSLFETIEQSLKHRTQVTRVLVVEDDPDLARVLMTMFESHGIEVYHAATGQEAIHMSQQVHPNLLLLDLTLSDGDGFAVVEWLRLHDYLCNIPLVVYTGLELSNRERDRLKLGPTEFFTKGRITPEDFEQQAIALLNRIVS